MVKKFASLGLLAASSVSAFAADSGMPDTTQISGAVTTAGTIAGAVAALSLGIWIFKFVMKKAKSAS